MCGAGPATAIGTFVSLVQERGWTVQVIATPRRPRFLRSGRHREGHRQPVGNQYSKPGAPRSQIPDTIIVAPASYNTINKWALGISDTYALGVLAETTRLDVPIVVLPFVNSTLVGREPFRRSAEALCAEGVRILPGPGGFQPRKSQSPHLSGAGRGTAQTLITRGFARACRRPGPHR